MGKKLKVLIVEDHEATLGAVADILESLGYRAVVTKSGEEALAILSEKGDHPDVILTDLVMPGVGGVDLFMQARQLYPTIPVVVMTGYPLGQETRDFLEGQNLRWLRKPFNSENLLQAIQDAISGSP